MKATAPEKMMPSDKAQKMRECEKRADQQKIKMEDRSRFVNECVAPEQNRTVALTDNPADANVR